jgi:hypothetical protein
MKALLDWPSKVVIAGLHGACGIIDQEVVDCSPIPAVDSKQKRHSRLDLENAESTARGVI